MHRLVPALEEARQTRAKTVKTRALAAAFRAIASAGDDDDLRTAVRLVSGFLLPVGDVRTLGVGYALVVDAASEALDVPEVEVAQRARGSGDLGDGIEPLVREAPSAEERPGLSIAEVQALATRLAETNDRGSKRRLLADAYARARPGDAKYLTKVLLGELRIGVREGIVEEAVAAAFDAKLEEVRNAALVVGDPGELAVLASHGELSRAEFAFGVPIAFMLASPAENVQTTLDLAHTVWEDKLDGIRVQVHAKPGSCILFSRGMGDVTRSFPEIAAPFTRVVRPVVVDGEVLAVSPDKDGGFVPRPFQALQPRLGRKDPAADLIAENQVALVAFDLLFDERPLLSEPWTARRERLVALFRNPELAAVGRVAVAYPFDPASPEAAQVDAAFEAARGRGHEGIVLKDARSPYEAGRRGGAWRKVKRAFATLDVVITRAEHGHGRRAQVLSDYTFAVRDGQELVEIGKAYTGLTDAEIATMTESLLQIVTGKHGGQLLVEPKIVLEIAFDGIQPSTRHASGFALRFPRIVRVRTDKTPDQIDTLNDARRLFEAQVSTGHREEAKADKPDKPKTRKQSKTNDRQLSLFGGPLPPKR